MTLPIEQGLCRSDPHDPCCPGSPIIVDLEGDGFNLTDLAGGVHFNLNPQAGGELISWTAPGSDDAWLALDRNGNGVIDDGSELFGNFTPQGPSDSPQGYLALAEFDRNHDGVIDSRDMIFDDLRLWQDRNHDGVSDPEELSTLEAHGIVGLGINFTGHRLTDEHGNLFRYSADVLRAPGSHVGPKSFDVFLITQALDQQARDQGAFQQNGAVTIAVVASSGCGGGGGGEEVCHYTTPAQNFACAGGPALCFACGTSVTSSTAHCSRVCEGWKGSDQGGCVECVNPSSCAATFPDVCSSGVM